MHQPGYIQEGQEAIFGDLLLGIYHRRIPGDTGLFSWCPSPPPDPSGSLGTLLEKCYEIKLKRIKKVQSYFEKISVQ